MLSNLKSMVVMPVFFTGLLFTLPACNSTPTKSATATIASKSKCEIEQNYTKEDETFLGSPLNFAVSTGNLVGAECLLKNGADPNAYNLVGETPLKVAITRKQPEMVALLIRYKASVNKPTTALTTPDGCGNEKPMDVAKQSGDAQILALLNGAETAGECSFRPDQEMKLMESVDPMRNPRMYQ